VDAKTEAFLRSGKDVMVRAGKISRHPLDAQRSSQLARWTKKCGTFERYKMTDRVQIVPAGKDRYWAIDGGHTVEACCADKRFGPTTLLPCTVYGNGTVPTAAQKAELFRLRNSFRVSVGTGTDLRIAVTTGDPLAHFAVEQSARLGRKFRTQAAVFLAAQKIGQAPVRLAVDTLLGIWGTKYHIRQPIFNAILSILCDPKAKQELAKRSATLSKKEPDDWYNQAKIAEFKTLGQRASTQDYLISVLLNTRRPR